MLSIQMMPASTPKLGDLTIKSQLNPSQLQKIVTELEWATIAIAALKPIDSIEIEKIAKDLQLGSIDVGWLNRWFTSIVTSPKQYAPEQLREIVLVVSQLARDRQTLIRQNISSWQQTVRANQLPLQSPSLADYIGNFITIYQTRFGKHADMSFELLSDVALNLSIDLLFYSSPNGHQRLWGALWERAYIV